jgi:type III pantothenate kinase
MYLLLDAGNSRIKFACHDGEQWLERGTLDTPKNLAAHLPQGFHPDRIILSSVASAELTEALLTAIRTFNAPFEQLQATHRRAGLNCGYAEPAYLGPDRWAAAIGAWHTIGADCLVVSAGTATTIDLVQSPGRFIGGCILPGLSLMFEALAHGTANLPRVTGEIDPIALKAPATDTLSAIQTGCLHAQLGAIERMAALLSADSPILLAGGNAHLLAPHLGDTAQLQPWLVMEGLLCIVKESVSNATTGEKT